MIAQYYYSEKNNTLYVNTDILVPRNADKNDFDRAFQMTIKERIEKYAPDNAKKGINYELETHKGCQISEFTYPIGMPF